MELIPPNEPDRLRAVRRYDILDTPQTAPLIGLPLSPQDCLRFLSPL